MSEQCAGCRHIVPARVTPYLCRRGPRSWDHERKEGYMREAIEHIS